MPDFAPASTPPHHSDHVPAPSSFSAALDTGPGSPRPPNGSPVIPAPQHCTAGSAQALAVTCERKEGWPVRVRNQSAVMGDGGWPGPLQPPRTWVWTSEAVSTRLGPSSSLLLPLAAPTGQAGKASQPASSFLVAEQTEVPQGKPGALEPLVASASHASQFPGSGLGTRVLPSPLGKLGASTPAPTRATWFFSRWNWRALTPVDLPFVGKAAPRKSSGQWL